MEGSLPTGRHTSGRVARLCRLPGLLASGMLLPLTLVLQRVHLLTEALNGELVLLGHCAGARQLLAQLHQMRLLLLPVSREQSAFGVQLRQVVLALVELGRQRRILARLLKGLASQEGVLARDRAEGLDEGRWHCI